MTAVPGPISAVALLAAILALQFLALIGVAAFELRSQRRRRRLRERSAALLARLGGGAADRAPAERPFPRNLLRWAPELAAEIALREPGREVPEAARARLEDLRRRAVEDLARTAAALQRRRWRLGRGASRKRFLGGLELLEALPSSENLPLLVAALGLEDDPIRARTAVLLAARPRLYSAALIPLAGVLRSCSALCLPSIDFGFRELALANPEQLAPLGEDPSPRVRRAVVVAAGRAVGGSPAAGDGLRGQLGELIEAATFDTSAKVREAAYEALAVSGAPRALEVLGRGLSDEVLEVRVAAARSHAALRDPRAVSALLDRLEDASPLLSREVLRALGRLTAPDLGPVISELTGSNPQRQVMALRALGVLGGGDEAKRIARFLEHRDRRLRLEAARAIANVARSPDLPLRGTPLVERLCRRLEREKDDLVAGAVVEAIASSGDLRAAPALLNRIGQSSPVLQEELVEGLAFLDHLVYGGSRSFELA